jgi:hypothetical protein
LARDGTWAPTLTLNAFAARHGRRPDRAPGDVAMLERLEQQKKLTANQWKIIATAGVGDMLDFFDFF